MKNFVLLATLCCLLACSQQPENDAAEMEVSLMKLPPSPKKQLEAQIQTVNKSSVIRKLVRDGFVEFETVDIDKTRSLILSAVSANNAYISSDEENKMTDTRSYTLTVRVPSIHFDTFLASATKGVLSFDRKKIYVEDVTAEYSDHETRLRTKKEIETRYLHLLNRASTVKDILSIEKELGTVRTEIESAEGQLNLLKDKVQYSTLQIIFYKSISTPSLFSHQVKAAFVSGWENLLGFILRAIDLWPFVLLGVGLWLGIAAWRRKRRLRKQVGLV